MEILFVCTGNTCRSPMAEAFFNKQVVDLKLPEVMRATSAGLMAYGQPATIPTLQVMAGHGLDVSGHQSRPVTGELVERASLVLAMTKEHSLALARTYPEHEHKIFALGDLVGRLRAENVAPGDGEVFGDTTDIADPYGGTSQDYEYTSAVISGYITELVSAIKKGKVKF